MNYREVLKNQTIYQPELTAFVREVLLPGSGDTSPKLDSRFCFFGLDYRRSPIHRWGIFAAKKIPARRRVIEYTGQKIGAREVWRRRVRQHLYIFWLDEKQAIDGAVGGSGAEFINHGCEPNLAARVAGGRIYFVSLRSIKAGEELTLDYNLDDDGSDIECSCGAENCRESVNRKV
jgi:uncharacterized protein